MAVTPGLWSFMSDKDKKKLAKAGFATPRGGGKNAYQNHVSRSNRVIVPYERLEDVDLDLFRQGYVIRVLPEQYFESAGVRRSDFREDLEVGENAFVLYRTHASYETLPPLGEWEPRGLSQEGVEVAKRGAGVVDTGHYVLRLTNPKNEIGAPQGIFAPEYADRDDNVQSQAVLAYLITQTLDAPYEAEQAKNIRDALDEVDGSLLDGDRLREQGMVDEGGTSTCPLCLKRLGYEELHRMLDLSEAIGLANAAVQVEGATRSTIVNLFHQRPLLYGRELHHKPDLVAWGHAICNTLLGQRRCIPLSELQRAKRLALEEETFGWIDADELMIRSGDGGVWVQLLERGHSHAPLSEELEDSAVLGEEDEEEY